MLNLTNGLGSVTSLKSLDDGRSSRTSSFGSQAECEHNFCSSRKGLIKILNRPGAH